MRTYYDKSWRYSKTLASHKTVFGCTAAEPLGCDGSDHYRTGWLQTNRTCYGAFRAGNIDVEA